MLKAAPSSGQPQAIRGTTGQDRACEQIRVSGSLVRPAHYHNHDCEHPCAYQHSLYVLQCFFAWECWHQPLSALAPCIVCAPVCLDAASGTRSQPRDMRAPCLFVTR
jgi:hypothetical protein